jgi:hypothetical protein
MSGAVVPSMPPNERQRRRSCRRQQCGRPQLQQAGNWQGHGGSGRGWNGYGRATAAGPRLRLWLSYGYDYGDSGYAYDGYAYDNGYAPDVYAQGESGAYCRTLENSCALDHPSVAGEPCQCRRGFDIDVGSRAGRDRKSVSPRFVHRCARLRRRNNPDTRR